MLSPASSSDLPEDVAGRDFAFLFGLAPGGVYHAASCCQLRGALLPHHFTLTCRGRRYIFCCTFRRLTPPRNYLAPCPLEPGLSSFPHGAKTRLPGRLSRLLSTTTIHNGRVGNLLPTRITPWPSNIPDHEASRVGGKPPTLRHFATQHFVDFSSWHLVEFCRYSCRLGCGQVFEQGRRHGAGTG